MVANLETTYETGILKITDIGHYKGLGSYIYEGPTFTVTLPVYGSITVSYGESFYGVLSEAMALGHGSFDNGDVILTEITYGVLIMDGTLAGLIILYGTGTYMYT